MLNFVRYDGWKLKLYLDDFMIKASVGQGTGYPCFDSEEAKSGSYQGVFFYSK